MSSPFAHLTAAQLRKAATLREKLDALQKELAAILETPTTAATKAPAKKQPAKRHFSAATRAKMRQRAKERWASVKASGKKSL